MSETRTLRPWCAVCKGPVAWFGTWELPSSARTIFKVKCHEKEEYHAVPHHMIAEAPSPGYQLVAFTGTATWKPDKELAMNIPFCAKCGKPVSTYSWTDTTTGDLLIKAYCHGEEETKRLSVFERHSVGSMALLFFAPPEEPKPESKPKPQSTAWFHALADESRREALVRAKARVAHEDPLGTAIEFYLLNDVIRKASRCPEGESLVAHIIRLRRAADGETP